MVFKAMLIWLMFIMAESLNGTIRELWLVPVLGDVRAHQVAFITGSILILTIAALFIRWLGASRLSQLFTVGFLWMVLAVAFEIVLGRFILGYSWERIAANYNLFQGGLMLIGLILLLLAPWIAAKLRPIQDQSIALK
ncbi:hypothetical protein NC981_19390 [Leptolyngbya sp. DQ-M1]|uniref:hypothetical protein n=1 Tax=Leptolyngbya sp. DQ-M1 TaxID=2933920 RepID=UPI0032979A5A